MVGIAVFIGRAANVVLDAPQSVEGCLLVEVVDYEHLAAIYLHAVPSESVDDQESLVRVNLDPLLELGARPEDLLVRWSFIEKILVISSII